MADVLIPHAHSRAIVSSPDPIAITRTLQSGVLRLRSTIQALKFAADAEHDHPQDVALYWPDLMAALQALVPDADALDEVVDVLRLARLRDTECADGATG